MNRLRLVLVVCIGLVLGGWYVGGLARFPDAPIQACGSGYCGKQGQVRSRADFEAYTLWERLLTFGALPAVLVMYFLNKGRANK